MYNFTTPATRSRRATTTLTDQEADILAAVLNYRIEKGRTTDMATLIRQCIEFALNSEPGARFDVPPPAHLSAWKPVNVQE